MTIRVYHPETNEPFDVTENKAADLVLNHGWTKSKTTTVAIEAPANPIVYDADDSEDTLPRWRGSPGRRGRKPVGSNNAEV